MINHMLLGLWSERARLSSRHPASGLWSVPDCKNQAKSKSFLYLEVKLKQRYIFPTCFISNVLVSMSFVFLSWNQFPEHTAPIPWISYMVYFPSWENNLSLSVVSIFSESPLQLFSCSHVVSDITQQTFSSQDACYLRCDTSKHFLELNNKKD